MSSMVLIVGVFSLKYFHSFPHLDRNFLNDFEVTKVDMFLAGREVD